jgi:hypothetical protein
VPRHPQRRRHLGLGGAARLRQPPRGARGRLQRGLRRLRRQHLLRRQRRIDPTPARARWRTSSRCSTWSRTRSATA